MIRGKKIYPVITPAEISGEIRDWHHFNNGNADTGQLFQLFGRCLPRSFFRESADVHFVNDLASHLQTAPIRVAPFELRWIDHARRAMRTVRLITRRRVGMKMLGVVDAETIERAGADIRAAGKISA